MEKVKIYQIGLGHFGRHGFDRLVDIAKEFEDVELCGVCDRDLERLQKAKKFAEVNGIEIQKFQKADRMYREASGEDAEVMVYDAGPADLHSDNVYRSMRHDFFHLAEKPPSMNRGEHIKEKRLAEQGKAMWKCDFIERESPVVRKAIELLDGERIDSIEVFRESTTGVEKALDNFSRLGVKGGDILDKMVHEVYVLDMLEASGENIELELKDVDTHCFQPWSIESDTFTGIHGQRMDELNYETATARTEAELKAGKTDVKLHSSWMGLSRKAMDKAEMIEQKTGKSFLSRETSSISDSLIRREEARFFIVEGSRRIAGDMLDKRLFDLENGEEIQTPDFIHDQLHRVLEKSIIFAGGRDVELVSDKEVDVFMNSIFDVKEAVDTDRDYYEELSKAQNRIEEMRIEKERARLQNDMRVAG